VLSGFWWLLVRYLSYLSKANQGRPACFPHHLPSCLRFALPLAQAAKIMDKGPLALGVGGW